ncbi:MAG: hypothetical protein Fur0018_16430 [Anaerolineales bacterium]
MKFKRVAWVMMPWLLAWGFVAGWLYAAAPTHAAEQNAAWVRVLAASDADLRAFFQGQAYHRDFGAFTLWAGFAADPQGVQAAPGVLHVALGAPTLQIPRPDPAHTLTATLDMALRGRERIAAIQQRAAQNPHPARPQTPLTPADWYENDVQGVKAAWNTYGVDGSGVRIAVIDSGVDFGNPALQGRFAVQPATAGGSQAYVGWPIAFDDRSLGDYLSDSARAWPQNWGWFVNAAHAVSGAGAFTFTDPLNASSVYTAPGASQSGTYYLGYHPDVALGGAPLLVSDDHTAGQYDSVYLDLDLDGAFETRVDKSSPVAALDVTADGVPDLSAGLLTWIADGLNPPPGALAVYGASAPVPPAGQMVTFMLDDLYLSGGGHGTMVAGTAVGNDGGVFVPESRVASFYTATYGSLVQGPAPGAKIIPIGNVYADGAIESAYLFTIVGLDGVPGTGDEPHIVNMSYGDGAVENTGWDWESRFLTQLNLDYGAQSPLFVHASGNGGSGYGTLISPSPATGLNVGASSQFGTLNFLGTYETVTLPSRVNYGDILSFSGRGPDAGGARPLDLVSNGMTGSAAYALNGTVNGTLGYVHWYGTSRSAPMVSGIAALAYQAFYQSHGRYPGWQEAADVLRSSADDLHNDPLAQGAGLPDAFRSVQVAAGDYGVTVSPAVLVGGDFRGQTCPGCGRGVSPGAVFTLPVTVTNRGGVLLGFSLGAQILSETARYTVSVPTLSDSSTNYFGGAPDYAVNLTPWVQAHPDADLMVVRLTTPFDHFDTLPPTPSQEQNHWRLMVYNWWDDHADGQWWTDLNANGRLDAPAELDLADEWLRFDYGWRTSSQQEVRVRDPYARSLAAGSAGVWAGAAHYRRAAGDNSTSLYFEVIFYRRVPWEAVTLTPQRADLGAGETLTVQVRAQAGALPGLAQGFVVLTDTGRTDLNPNYQPHVTHIPLTWQVWPDISAGVTLGGAAQGHLYENGAVQGAFAWANTEESGDWRFFGFDVQNPPPYSVLLAHTTWKHYPTDLDALFFGPQMDAFSASAPAGFGPAGLAYLGGSLRDGNAPRWNFQTATGGTQEWAAVTASDGWHVLAQEAVLYGGLEAQEPFTTALGLVTFDPAPLRFDPAACGVSCTLTFTVRSSIPISGGLAAQYGLGWLTPQTRSGNVPAGGAALESFLPTAQVYRLDVEAASLSGMPALDIALYDDSGTQPGVWDSFDQVVARRPWLTAGTRWTPEIPSLGQHWLRLQSADGVSGGAYTLRVTEYTPAVDDGALSLSGLPASLQAGQRYTLTATLQRAAVLGQRGLLTFGPPALPTAFNLPVQAESLADLWVDVQGTASAEPGQTAVYTVTYGSRGPSSTQAQVALSLPAGFYTAQALSRTVTLFPATQHTWVVTASLGSDLPLNTPLTVTASIQGQAYDLLAADNRAETGFFLSAADAIVLLEAAPTVQPGRVLTVTLTAGNYGPAEVPALTVTLTLPPGLSDPVAPGGVYTLTTGALLPGYGYQYFFYPQADVDIRPGTTLTLTARVAAPYYDPAPLSNMAVDTVAVPPEWRIYLPLVERR